MRYAIELTIVLLALQPLVSGNTCSGQSLQALTETELYKLNTKFLNPDNIQQASRAVFTNQLLYSGTKKIWKGNFNWEAKLYDQLRFGPGLHGNNTTTNKIGFTPLEINYQLSLKNITVSAGRKKVKVGVAYVSSPSEIIISPVLPDDPTDRLRNIRGSDLVQLSYVKDNYQVDLYYLPFSNRQTNNYFHTQSVAVRYYRIISPFEFTSLARIGFNGRYQVALNGTVAIGNKLELHTDNMLQSNSDVLYPSMRGFTTRNQAAFRGLAGGQWSPTEKFNIVVEYMHFTEGYLMNDWNSLAGQVGTYRMYYQSPIDTISGKGIAALQQLYPYRRFPNKRNYIFTRFFLLKAYKDIDLELVNYLGLDDGGSLSRLGGYYRYGKCSFYVNIQVVSGAGKTGFAAYDQMGFARIGARITVK